MRLAALSILSTVCILHTVPGTSAQFNPFQNGPYKTMHKNFLPWITSGLNHYVDVWAPDTAEPVETPIIYFAGGLGGLMPGELYMNLFAKVASHGITIVQPMMNDPIGNYEGVWMDDVMEWGETHLAKELANAGIGSGLILDHHSLFLMGHSAGGHVAVEYLKHHCGYAKGTILMSPVDGFDPFGLIPIYAITPGEYLNVAIPSLVLAAGLDNVKGIDGAGAIVPACAPNDMSNQRFYDAMPEKSWFVNATYYGHGDNLDDFYADSIEFTHFCAVADKSRDREDYRRHISGMITSFIKFTLGQEDCSVLEYLQDPSLMPVDATVMYKPSAIDSSEDVCQQCDCKWQADPYPHL